MTVKDGEELLRSDETPGVQDMEGEFPIADFAELDADPTLYSNVRRFEVLSGRTAKERLLSSGRGGNPDGDVTVVVMIVGEHREDFFIDEERRFSMREPF
jgi:hypothetical protein